MILSEFDIKTTNINTKTSTAKGMPLLIEIIKDFTLLKLILNFLLKVYNNMIG